MAASKYRVFGHLTQDRRGASIIIALLFFLVCIMVGAVVITAASTNTGRLVDMVDRQQSYYTVSSATQLMRDEFQGSDYRYDPATMTTTCDIDDANLAKMASDAVVYVNAHPGSSAQTTLTVDATGSGLEKVTLDFTMKPDYSILISARLDDDSQNAGIYRMNLEVPAALAYADDGTLTRVTWEQATITKQGGA